MEKDDGKRKGSMLTRVEKRLINHERLQELVNQIDPKHSLDPEVEDVILKIAEDFIENVIDFGCKIAKNRGSEMLEVKDIQLHLENNWNIHVPGYSPAQTPIPHGKYKEVDEHVQRKRIVANHNVTFLRKKKQQERQQQQQQQQQQNKQVKKDLVM